MAHKQIFVAFLTAQASPHLADLFHIVMSIVIWAFLGLMAWYIFLELMDIIKERWPRDNQRFRNQHHAVESPEPTVPGDTIEYTYITYAVTPETPSTEILSLMPMPESPDSDTSSGWDMSSPGGTRNTRVKVRVSKRGMRGNSVESQ